MHFRFFGGRLMKPILGTAQAECGLICLAMIAEYHGYRSELRDLRDRLSPSLRGTSIKQLIGWAKSLGLSAKALRLRLSELGSVACPAILHWRFTHYVVLEKVRGDTFVIIDPQLGRRKLTRAEMSEAFTGIAVEFLKGPEFQRLDQKRDRLHLSDVWPRLRGDFWAHSLIAMLSIIALAALLLVPLFTQRAIDQLVASNQSVGLNYLAAGFAAIGLFGVLAQVSRRRLTISFGSVVASHMVGNIARMLFRIEPEWFARRHVGDIESRFASVIEIQQFVLGHFTASVIDFVIFLAVFFLLATISPAITLVVLVLLTTQIAAVYIGTDHLKSLEVDRLVQGSRQTSVFHEILRNIASIKVRRGEENRWAYWHNLYEGLLAAEQNYQKAEAVIEAITSAVMTVGPILIVYFAANLVASGSLTIGQIMAILMLYVALSGASSRLGKALQDYRRIQIHLSRLSDIVFAPRAKNSSSAESDRTIGTTPIVETRNLSFRYSPSDQFVFDGVNIAINPGTSVAIIGRTGAGKSTFLRLLLGLLRPTCGGVYIDGVRLDDETLPSWLDAIGVVMQDDQLMSGTIAANIAFFEMPIDMDRVREASRIAEVDAEIMSMPLGYDTELSDLGSTLSGGQRQRVILARALYRRPAVLLLDEATSNLDLTTEKNINSNLALRKISKIVISHRPQSIGFADAVYEMVDGQLRLVRNSPEQGYREQVSGMGGS